MKNIKKYRFLIILALGLFTCVLGIAATQLFRPTICDRPVINRFRGIDYDIVFQGQSGISEQPLTATNLGPVFDKVQANPMGCNPLPQNNVSTMFRVGTPLYTVQSYRPTFRLAAYNGTSIILLQAVANPNAKTGADLLDIHGKVQSIVVSQSASTNAQGTPTTTSSTITDPKQIASLVTMILTAPVMEYNTAGFTGKSYELQFHLRDGTILTSAYWPDSGEMHEGEENIVLPQAFRVALEQAMRK